MSMMVVFVVVEVTGGIFFLNGNPFSLLSDSREK
jgi:hypothetical protein